MWTKERITKLQKAAKALIFTAGFVCILFSLSRMMQYKAAVVRVEPFFEIEEPIDVMFFGTSHVINGVLPLELWEDYGISSYNFGNNGARIPLTYWMMENVFDYQQPKLVVVDCSYLYNNKMTATKVHQAHIALDAFPLTSTKLATINDLFLPEERLEFLLPFTIYHNRWTELGKSDFVVNYNTQLGASPKTYIAVPDEYAKLPEGTTLPEETVAMEYLEKMIDSCQAKGIEILLTYIPYPANETRQREAASAQELALKRGVNCINFLTIPDVVNFTTDCHDPHSHLNLSGARKITDYLGSYIRTNYDIPDRRTEARFASWDSLYESYAEATYAAFQKTEILSTYLLRLADKNVQSTIYVREDSIILKDTRLHALLDNAAAYGFQTEVNIVTADAFALINPQNTDGDIYIEVYQAATKAPVDTTCFKVVKELPLTINRKQ